MNAGLDLMPARARQQRIKRDAAKVWLIVLLLTIAACTAAVTRESLAGRSTRQQLAALEAQHRPMLQLQTDLRTLHSKIDELKATEKLALELSQTRPLATLLGVVGDSAAAAASDLYVESLEYARPSAHDIDGSPTVRLTGAANNTLAVTRLVEELRSSGVFREVQLRSTRSLETPTQTATGFTLDCEVY